MESPFWLQSCDHQACLPQRFEYCIRELDDSPDEVAHIIEVVEDTLMQPYDGYSGLTYKSQEKGVSEHSRSFIVNEYADNEHQVVNSQQIVTINVARLANPTRTIHTVVDQWRLASDDELSEPIKRLYTIETYLAGPSKLTVTEGSDIRPDITSRVYEDRTMAPYDIGQLHELLELVKSQYSSNARSR